MRPSASIRLLPDDVILQIVSSLQVEDVCSLGSCSWFWRELCESDAAWEYLCSFRWPQVSVALGGRTHHSDHQLGISSSGSMSFYIAKHNEMASKAASIFNFVERYLTFEALDVGYYLKAIEDLYSMQFGFKDIQMLIFNPDINVVFNMIGLHYCISWLSVPAESVIDALREYKISEREVCVMWRKLNPRPYFLRLRAEKHSRHVSLSGVSMQEKEVLEMLQRGTTNVVLRILISPPKPADRPWSSESARSGNQC